MPASSDSHDYGRFDQLAEEYAERYRRGEQPVLEEYVDRLPEMADEIREMFPALVEVEQVEGDARKDALDHKRPAAPPLTELGDYRIVREIGHGGMGVVYEAEQVSLGRRVALKVLPGHVVGDRKVLERFRREAKAAARLHHTNIVPVFEIGREGQVAFYTMQFIQGQGLDQVIDELRRLRAPDRKPVGKNHDLAESWGPVRHAMNFAGSSAKATCPENRMLGEIAESILSGRLATGAFESSTVAASQIMETTTRALIAGPAATDALPRHNGEFSHETTPAKQSVLGSAVLPGGTAVSTVESSGRRQPFFRSVAQIGCQAAQGLAYAHSRGIVHRDIKPSNLLLDNAGVVWITDFGLAKADEDGLTASGDILGTFRYMAPERFRGEGDGRADIYALGLTLYELLTLRPAFESSDRLKLIERIKSEEPSRPRSIDGRIPRDLETIVLKAIEKDPKSRYPSADAMGADLGRFLADEPIKARQVRTAERCWRWARRNTMTATLIGVLAAVLIATSVGSMFAATYFRRLAGNESRANAQLVVARKGADDARRQALEERDHSRRQSTDLALDKGIALAEQGELAHGLRWMLEGLHDAPAESAELTRVIRINLAAWSEQVHGLRNIIRVPIRAGPSAYRCAFSPDGRLIAVASADRLEYWDTKTLEPTGKALVFDSLPEALAFSPDGMTLVTGHERGEAVRWDVATGRRKGVNLPHAAMVRGVAFSPDGKVIVTGCVDGTVRFWDSSTGRPLGAPISVGKYLYSVAFAPDGRSIVIGTGTDGRGGAAYIWDVSSRAKLAGPLTHDDTVFAVAFNPDGTTFVTGCRDGNAQLWQRETIRQQGAPLWHRQAVYTVLFSPDGATIATRPRDELSAVLWERASGQREGTPLWHQGPVDCVALSPDGLTALSGAVDETVRVWDIGRNRSRPLDPNQRSRRTVDTAAQDQPRLPDYFLKKTVVYSPDRRTVLTSDGSRIARLWDTASGRPRGAPLRHARNVRTVAFSPDGRRVATACHDVRSVSGGPPSTIHIWDAATGRPIAPPIAQEQWVSALDFGPDGRVLASGAYDLTVRFWDSATGAPAREPIRQRGIVFSVAFSPDGKTLAVGTVDPGDGRVPPATEARLWDLATHSPLGRGMPHKDWVVDVAFSSDGRVLLTRSHDATTRLWDAKTGEPLIDYLRHEGLPAAVLSVDGRHLATAGNLEDDVRIWDARTGRPLPAATLNQGSQVTALAFSPDAALLGAGCQDGSARLWDVATGKPLGPALVQRSRIVAVTFTPDGSAFLTTAADGATRSWPVPKPMDGDTDRLALRLEVLTGMRMDVDQDVEKLTADEWDERCRRLTSLEGTVAGAYASAVSESDYHDARARDAEQDGITFAARWHLDRLIAMRASAETAGGIPDLWLLYARRARAWSIAGRLDQADADYLCADRLGSRSLILDWYAHRIVDCEQTANWQTALWYLDRCLAAEPGKWQLYVRRARVLGRLGKSDRSLADLKRAAQLDAGRQSSASSPDEIEYRLMRREAGAAMMDVDLRFPDDPFASDR
jgi:WD40 repeat protein